MSSLLVILENDESNNNNNNNNNCSNKKYYNDDDNYNENNNNNNDPFQFVETSIVTTLIAPSIIILQQEKERNNSNNNNNNDNNDDEISNHIIQLAAHADNIIFFSNTTTHDDDYVNNNNNNNNKSITTTNLVSTTATKSNNKNNNEKLLRIEYLSLLLQKLVINQSIPIIGALLITFNILENQIEQQIMDKNNNNNNNNNNNAPLLKNMIQQLDDNDECKIILEYLLLPSGLNIRNLLWHGFIGETTSLRPWLSLILLQMQHINNNDNKQQKVIKGNDSNNIQNDNSNDDNNTGSNHKQYDDTLSLLFRNVSPATTKNGYRWIGQRAKEQTNWILQEGKNIRMRLINNKSQNFSCIIEEYLIPKSHISLWEYCKNEIIIIINNNNRKNQKPFLLSMILVIILEHSLRILWCKYNNNNNKEQLIIAQPNKYYLTLDGYGQKHYHNIILHPYYYCYDDSDDDNNNNNIKSSNDSNNTTSNPEQQQQQQEEDQTMKKNQLVYILGGGIMSFLIDMFISGCNGPNIRSALAHGIYDNEIIYNELKRPINKENDIADNIKADTISTTTTLTNGTGWDLVDILLLAMNEIAIRISLLNHESNHTDQQKSQEEHNSCCLLNQKYRPMFSFTSQTIESLECISEELLRLQTLHGETNNIISITNHDNNNNFPSFSIPNSNNKNIDLLMLKTMVNDLIAFMTTTDRIMPSSSSCCWSSDDVYTEMIYNKKLEPLSASRTLLIDIIIATKEFNDGLNNAINYLKTLDNDDRESSSSRKTKREIKKMKRITDCVPWIQSLYYIATYIAILHIHSNLITVDDDDDDNDTDNNNHRNNYTYNINESGTENNNNKMLLKAVERSRMVISTVSTFIFINAERSYKAADQYIKSKIIKNIIAK